MPAKLRFKLKIWRYLFNKNKKLSSGLQYKSRYTLSAEVHYSSSVAIECIVVKAIVRRSHAEIWTWWNGILFVCIYFVGIIFRNTRWLQQFTMGQPKYHIVLLALEKLLVVYPYILHLWMEL